MVTSCRPKWVRRAAGLALLCTTVTLTTGGVARPTAAKRSMVGACSEREVSSPALIARRANALTPCWNALSDGDFWPAVVTHHLIIGDYFAGCHAASPGWHGVVALNGRSGRIVWRSPLGLSFWQADGDPNQQRSVRT